MQTPALLQNSWSHPWFKVFGLSNCMQASKNNAIYQTFYVHFMCTVQDLARFVLNRALFFHMLKNLARYQTFYMQVCMKLVRFLEVYDLAKWFYLGVVK